MLKEERYDKILEILNEHQYIKVEDLSRMLFVSLPTARRDLAELDRRNLIIRSHGGAKKQNFEHSVMPISYRKSLNFKEKRELCNVAFNFIKDGDIIFLDASTTTSEIAQLIPAKSDITVVTNSILISTILAKKNMNVFCTGGEFQLNSNCFAGEFAIDFIKNFNFDKVFFSSHGVNENNVIVDTSLIETRFRKAVLKQSKKSFFLCDKTKFGIAASYNLIDLKNVDYIITNKKDLNIKPKNRLIIV